MTITYLTKQHLLFILLTEQKHISMVFVYFCIELNVEHAILLFQKNTSTFDASSAFAGSFNRASSIEPLISSSIEPLQQSLFNRASYILFNRSCYILFNRSCYILFNRASSIEPLPLISSSIDPVISSSIEPLQ